MDPSAPTPDLSAGIEAIRQRFVTQLNERLERLYGVIEALPEGEASAQAVLETAEQVAHKIAGTASTLGFDELGASAAALENGARARLQADAVLDETTVGLIEDFLTCADEARAA